VAAVGAAAGAGLPVLAAVTTLMYFVVLYGLRPLARWARRFQPDALGLRIAYEDGRGLLRRIVALATEHGFAVVEFSTTSDYQDDEADQEHDTVSVSLRLTGRGNLSALTIALDETPGIRGVRRVESDIDD